MLTYHHREVLHETKKVCGRRVRCVRKEEGEVCAREGQQQDG